MRRLKFSIALLLILLSSCEKENLSDLKDIFYVRRNGADIPAYVYGNGSEKIFLVWLHGGPGVSSLPDRNTSAFKKLEDQYAVVYFDQRGQGMSQGHYSKTLNNIWEMGKDIKALALILKEKYGANSKLFLMGGSWGGALGTVTLLDKDAQGLFTGWIEVDGAHDSPARNQSTIDLINEIGQEQISLGNSVDYWTGAIQRVNNYDITIYDDCTNLNNEAYNAEATLQNDGIINLNESTGWKVYQTLWLTENRITTLVNGAFSSVDIEKYTDYAVNFSVTDSLYKIELPTLLIWGKYDMVVSPEIARVTYERISSESKELLILEHSGHNVALQQPTEFVNEIIGFIDEHK